MKLLKLVKLVKLISVYFFDISTSKKAQNPQFFTLLTSKCASRHNGVHFFDTFSTSEPPKVVRDRQFLTLLTWKCASRHNGVHFFNISTSKSGPELRCFVHFDLEMCFAPQRRALFWHLYFQKCSDHGVFCTFWLGNVLRATTACTFLTSILPKVLRPWCVLYILNWKSASRHNGVQFFISRLARTRRFSEPTFRPSGATNHWKNKVFRDFPTFSRICSVCPLTLSLLIFSLLIFLFSVPLPCSAFHLSILSEVWLLNFLRWSSYIIMIDKMDHNESHIYIYIWLYMCGWYVFTSSTAQGGGGSFKNRKPIGELGCCEWGMAERSHWWTERCLRSPLFLSLFLWLSTYLPAYLLCIYLSIDLSISLFLSFI